MNTPVVSVVIPTYNRADLLPRAMRSVMDQTFGDWEIVVVDDGSTDGTSQVAADFAKLLGDRWVYVRQENRGSSAARNRGIELARGRFVAFLDSDDEFAPTKLARQMELFEKCPELGLVYSDYTLIDEEGRESPSVFDAKFPIARTVPCQSVAPQLCRCKAPFFDSLVRGYFIATIVGMVRREVLGERIRFSESHAYAEEWLFFLQVAKATPAGFVDEPLSIHHAVRGSLARSDKQRNLLGYRSLLHAIRGTFADMTRSQAAAVRAQLATVCRQIGYERRRSRAGREAARSFMESFFHQPRLATLGEAVEALLSSRSTPPSQPATTAVR